MAWGEIIFVAAGSGITAGIVNNLAGGIRDKFGRDAVRAAAQIERNEARAVRREVAREDARAKNLQAVVGARIWIEQQILNLSEDWDGGSISYQIQQPMLDDIWAVSDAVMSVCHHHPAKTVRDAAKKLGSQLNEEAFQSIAGGGVGDRADLDQYLRWQDEIDDLIEIIHIPEGRASAYM